MRTFEAPAKVNFALHVKPPRPDGYHPVESLVQTVEWLDLVSLSEGESGDELEVEGLSVDPDDNLVLRALGAVRGVEPMAPQKAHLSKRIPVGAGLGGGSSDAAATLLAAARLVGLADVSGLAIELGADVPLFLVGGTLMVRGIGEVIEPLEPLGGFALGVVVPEFESSSRDVYSRWDEMEGPEGEAVRVDLLPPQLRDGIPIRNDLLPAALSLEPGLGDLMADLRTAWGGPVCLTGSGSAVFGFFESFDEAEDAAASAPQTARASRGVALRGRGVALVE